MLPWRFEAGTPNIAGVIAFGAAIDYLEGIGMRAVRQPRDRAHGLCACEVLEKIPNVTLYGPKDASIRGAAVSFNFERHSPP